MATTSNNKTPPTRGTGTRTGSTAPRRSTKKKKLTKQQIAMRREIYAGVCVLLALFCLLPLLKVQGFLLEWLQNIIGGAIGTGFILLPFCLLFAAGLFIVKRKGKVRLRVTCALVMPVLWGSAGHIFASTQKFALSVDGIVDLAVAGAQRQAGGLLSGTLAIGLSKALSDAGAIVILFLLGVICLLVSTNTSLAQMFERVHNLPPEEEEEPAPPRQKKQKPLPVQAPPPPPPAQEQPVLAPPPPAPQKQGLLSSLFGRRPTIDIPLEAPKEQPKGEPIPFAPPNVRTPDQVMGVEHQQSKPATTVAEPLKTDAVPQPVLGQPPAPVQEQAFPAAPAPRPVVAPVDPLPSGAGVAPQAEHPVTQDISWQAEPQPQQEERLPWEDEEEELVPFEPPAPALDAELQRAAALAAAQSPAESLGREGPEWDSPDQQAAKEAQRALSSALHVAPRDTYLYPPISLLAKSNGSAGDYTQELAENSARLVDTLKSFGVEANLVDITRGPSVTRYELQLKRGTKFSRVTNLSDDIALSLGASSVRIATIPDKLAVGIEVPNTLVELVTIRDIIDSQEFKASKSRISFSVGKDITGHNVVGDIKKMPHMLIAGTTGSGKSVCINSLLISLIYKATPQEVRLIMVDPKMIELGVYNGIPHLLIPVVTDPRKAAGALNWAVSEMMRRYKLFSELNVRDLEAYNSEITKQEGGEKLPQIVIVIDELADLMFVAASEVENAIVRIAQMARAAGMHLVIATQRPSADVITGIMKANIPSRISFAVASQIESRIILDTTGAEKLVGRGDMLYNPLGAPKPLRVQGCFITTAEIEGVVEFVKKTGEPDYSEEVMEHIEKQAESAAQGGGGDSGGRDDDDEDEMLPRAIEVVVETGQASVSMLQRRLKLGYARAARLVDQMAERGIVGPFEGSKPRQLLISREEWHEMVLRQKD